MRHCFGETVSVYQSTARTLAKALTETAVEVGKWEDKSDWLNVTVQLDIEDNYIVTLYVHNPENDGPT